jgi:hypothetical protein
VAKLAAELGTRSLEYVVLFYQALALAAEMSEVAEGEV